MRNYLDLKQFRAKLNNSVSLRHLYNLCEAGHKWATKKLGKWLVDVDAFQEWMEAPETTPAAPSCPPETIKQPQRQRRGRKRQTHAQRRIELW